MNNSVSPDTTSKDNTTSSPQIPSLDHGQAGAANHAVNAYSNAPQAHNTPDTAHSNLVASASQDTNNAQLETGTTTETKPQSATADTTRAASFENEPLDNAETNDAESSHRSESNDAESSQRSESNNASGSEQQDAHDKPSRTYIRLKNTTAAELSQLESGRKLISFTRVAAPVSLLIGGVVLSGISLICSIISYLKITRVLKRHRELDLDDYRLFIRPVKIAILMAVLALIINAAFLYVEYPRILEAIETGQMSALFNSGTVANTVSPGTQAAPQPGSTTWG